MKDGHTQKHLQFLSFLLKTASTGNREGDKRSMLPPHKIIMFSAFMQQININETARFMSSEI